jgi:hypothetical protein
LRFARDDGIVVVEVGRDGVVVEHVSPVLQDRLSAEGTLGLLALLEPPSVNGART